MPNPVQAPRRLSLWFLTIGTAILTIVATLSPAYSLQFYFLTILILQLFFNGRRAWLLYAPLLTLVAIPLNILASGTADARIYSELNILSMLGLLLLGGLSEVIIKLVQQRQVKTYAPQINQASDEGQLFFSDAALHAAGLSDPESNFFKKQVRKHYQQVQLLADLQPQAQVLIPNFNADLALIQQLFRELVNAPQQMLKIDDFLYQHLPDYVNLVDGLLNMANNSVQTAADKAMLAATKEKLATFHELFAADYLLVTETERQHLQQDLTTSTSKRS
ncbi:5-bromo-4-chloroindolyl phosphate hydrolysis family protein [Loigolactobacillus binensis]|uniref:5-bromo-4-chloroindolyl phosphate hydrolysis family protein n=1 Tax=Loigolactobacillus binensis TaxID=2559922 RepID=A0ABW3E8N5_9LACO|nr:5-bromo-4-chloroindolyl phosphate hydrolysis family protein [Loigolactobacillus binensis]